MVSVELFEGERVRKLAIAFFKGVWIYSLILWGYIVADLFAFPQYQYSAISRYISIPQNLIADIAFPVSFVSFVLWDYLRKTESRQRLQTRMGSDNRRNKENEIAR